MEPLLLFYDHRQREMAKQATELGENDENSVEKKYNRNIISMSVMVAWRDKRLVLWDGHP